MSCSLLHPLCFFNLSYLLLLPAIAQTNNHNISLGSSLTASSDHDNTSAWTSPSGDFAFGFQPIDSKGFLLCIWFNKIPEKTIVWSANQSNLVQKGSKVELTAEGHFLLQDLQGKEIWKVPLVNNRIAYASLLDNGNFVLCRKDSVIIWESFDVPTDTILPTQTLELGSTLVSRRTQTNYSSGRFLLRLESNGNLLLYTITLTIDEVYEFYWQSNRTGSQMVFNNSGYLYLTQTNGSLLKFTPENVPSTTDFYHRATLDYDGVMRQYVYPKAMGRTNGTLSKSWSIVWSVPENICLSIAVLYGSGACGYNSYCRQDEDQRPTCECPPGYSYMDPKNKFSGCKPNFVPQSCNAGSQEDSLFDMGVMPNTDWSGHDYEGFKTNDEDWCRQACLDDCLCAIAIFQGSLCWKKGFPFANGKYHPGLTEKTLVKLRRQNSSHLDSNLKNENNSANIVTTRLVLGGSVAMIFIFIAIVFLFYLWKKTQKIQPYMSDMNLQSFTYKELVIATNSFKEELGRGASATVYRAVLAKHVVAVKKLEERVTGEREFLAEVKAIGQTSHKNLVELIGFCNEGTHRLLVYEFMSNGSLASFLYGSSKPKWEERIQLACGVARGLTYLHEDRSSPTIHCDIKPQNILLDNSFTARISDFELAKLLRADQTRTSTGIRGTRGYVAPEWFMNMAITVKVDVYSFGIMLLEIICCRKNVESEVKDEHKVVLSDWAYDCYVDGRLDVLVENDEEAMDHMETLEKMVMIAIWCIQEEPSLRPSMNRVTRMLDGDIHVYVPPNPCSISIHD